MKILYLSFADLPSRTANSIHVMKMCQAFAAEGHDVTLLAPRFAHNDTSINLYDYYGTSSEFSIKRVNYPSYKGKEVINLAAAAKAILLVRPELIYGRHLPYCFLGTRFGIPTAFEAHSPVNPEHRIGRYYYNSIVKSRCFLKMVVISNALKSIFEDVNKLSHEFLFVAHDGADLPEDTVDQS